MSDVKKVWNEEGNRLYSSYPSKEFDTLENAIYNVGQDEYGRFYLTKNSDKFDFDYKVYGLETGLVNRVIKTYLATKHGNLGVLLNGLKGTGKTVSSKIIANSLNQPIILVDSHIKGIHVFLNNISQNITIFIDEYEKVFGESSAMLTIMDGALNSDHRRVFLLTTNELYVDKNLIQRPGRIRYFKKFEDLKPSIVEEIVDDCLVHKEFKTECINFVSNLETITVDIVKAIISEINIHEEGPSAFESIFNVKKLKGRYNVEIKGENNELSPLAKSIHIHPRPTFNDGHVGYNFQVDNNAIGTISRVIDWTTIEVSPFTDGKGKNLGFDEPIILKITDADIINYSYAYDYGNSVVKPVKTVSKLAEKIMDAIENRDEDEDMGEESTTHSTPIIAESAPMSLQLLTKGLNSSTDNKPKSER